MPVNLSLGRACYWLLAALIKNRCGGRHETWVINGRAAANILLALATDWRPLRCCFVHYSAYCGSNSPPAFYRPFSTVCERNRPERRSGTCHRLFLSSASVSNSTNKYCFSDLCQIIATKPLPAKQKRSKQHYSIPNLINKATKVLKKI